MPWYEAAGRDSRRLKVGSANGSLLAFIPGHSKQHMKVKAPSRLLVCTIPGLSSPSPPNANVRVLSLLTSAYGKLMTDEDG